MSVKRCAASLSGRFDDFDCSEAVHRPLREQHAAPKHRGQLAGAEWLARKGWQHTSDIVRVAQLDPVEHLTEVSLARISRPPARSHRPNGTDVVLAQQQHLDREVGMRQQRGERNQPVEHIDRGPTLRGPADRENLAVLIDAYDPPPRCDGVHDPHPVPVKQIIELGAQRTKAAGLHLDQLAIGAHDVDHEPPDRHLHAVTRPHQHRLERGMQRSLAHHADARHASQAKAGGGGVDGDHDPSNAQRAAY